MKLIVTALLALVLASCGDSMEPELMEPNSREFAGDPAATPTATDNTADDPPAPLAEEPDEEPPSEPLAEPPADGEDPGLIDDGSSAGEPAEAPPVGAPVDTSDPDEGADPCLEQDVCEPEPTPEPGEEAEPPPPATEYSVGEKLIVKRYAAMRQRPNNSAPKVGIHTSGGAHNGHPSGVIPPGQRVNLLKAQRENGFYRVEYKGYAGWVHRNRLAKWDKSVHPVKFARRAAVRNAFFMHQIRRARWNKDGPLSSANCAPTSLAMAAKIFGKGTKGKTIELSIHEARNSFNAPADESDGTSRAEIVRGARAMGLDVQELGTNLSLEAEMDRIDKHLGFKRAIVLEGEPGSEYRSRMTAAFRAGGSSRSYTYSDKHSILVVAKLDNGKYLVADPISEVGMVTMSRAALKSFFRSWGGTGTAVYDRDWKK